MQEDCILDVSQIQESIEPERQIVVIPYRDHDKYFK